MLRLTSRNCFCSLLSNKLTFLSCAERSELFKQKRVQTDFRYLKFQNSFKKCETDRKSNFQLFCCIWHNIFGKKVEQPDLFVELLCFCWMKV